MGFASEIQLTYMKIIHSMIEHVNICLDFTIRFSSDRIGHPKISLTFELLPI